MQLIIFYVNNGKYIKESAESFFNDVQINQQIYVGKWPGMYYNIKQETDMLE